MTRFGKAAMALVVVSGAVLIVVAYWTGRDSTDAQEALVIPFLIFWTAVALFMVWGLDRALSAILAQRRSRESAKPS